MKIRKSYPPRGKRPNRMVANTIVRSSLSEVCFSRAGHAPDRMALPIRCAASHDLPISARFFLRVFDPAVTDRELYKTPVRQVIDLPRIILAEP